MFEQSLADSSQGGPRPAAILCSSALQVFMIGAAVATPLVLTEAIPNVTLASIFTAPPPPSASAPCCAPQEARSSTPAPQRQFDGSRLMMPSEIPERAVIFVDAPLIPGAVASGAGRIGSGEVLPGWFPPGFLSSLSGSSVPPPPKPSVSQPEEPQPIRRVTVGGRVKPPELLRSVSPIYPQIARQARVSGVVTLSAVIGIDGRIREVTPVSGHPLLLRAAQEAVAQWAYRPLRLNGEPVEVALRVEVRFQLSQ